MDRYCSRDESVGQRHNEMMSSWRGRVLAAEARKAEIPSNDTLRTLRQPCAIGIKACSH